MNGLSLPPLSFRAVVSPKLPISVVRVEAKKTADREFTAQDVLAVMVRAVEITVRAKVMPVRASMEVSSRARITLMAALGAVTQRLDLDPRTLSKSWNKLQSAQMNSFDIETFCDVSR